MESLGLEAAVVIGLVLSFADKLVFLGHGHVLKMGRPNLKISRTVVAISGSTPKFQADLYCPVSYTFKRKKIEPDLKCYKLLGHVKAESCG